MVHEIEVVRKQTSRFFFYQELWFDVIMASLFDAEADQIVTITRKDGAEEHIRLYSIGDASFFHSESVTLRSASYLRAAEFCVGDRLAFTLQDNGVIRSLKACIQAEYINNYIATNIVDKDLFNNLPKKDQERITNPLRIHARARIDSIPDWPLVWSF